MKMRKGEETISLERDSGGCFWSCRDWCYFNSESEAIAWAIRNGYMHEEPRSTPLRDHFAGLALQALVSLNSSDTPQRSALKAYEYADAMLKERDK